MRAEAGQFQKIGIELAVDENEIRVDVAVVESLPFAGKRVVFVAS